MDEQPVDFLITVNCSVSTTEITSRYLTEVGQIVREHYHGPLRREGAECTVVFSLDSTGRASKVGLRRVSDADAQNIAAVAAVQNSSPFPPPPSFDLIETSLTASFKPHTFLINRTGRRLGQLATVLVKAHWNNAEKLDKLLCEKFVLELQDRFISNFDDPGIFSQMCAVEVKLNDDGTIIKGSCRLAKAAASSAVCFASTHSVRMSAPFRSLTNLPPPKYLRAEFLFQETGDVNEKSQK